jgi:hypothetical protein
VSDLARRAIAWRHGYHAAVCDRVEPWAHGTVVQADDVPTYCEYDLARVEGHDAIPPTLDAEALAAGRGAVPRRPRPPADRGRRPRGLKRLYVRLGFRTVRVRHVFTRVP